MPSKKLLRKRPLSRHLRSLDRRRPKPKSLYASFLDPSSEALCALLSATLPDAANTKRLRFKRGEKKVFKDLQKRARKVGLLVSRESYDLYFRDNPGKSG